MKKQGFRGGKSNKRFKAFRKRASELSASVPDGPNLPMHPARTALSSKNTPLSHDEKKAARIESIMRSSASHGEASLHGAISRSNGIAKQTSSANDDIVPAREKIAAMRKLHPPLPQGSQIPPCPLDAAPIISIKPAMVEKILRKMASGASPGPSHWTPELLLACWDNQVASRGICILMKHILNGNLDKVGRDILTSSTLISISKPNGGQRPIAMGDTFYKLCALYLLKMHSSQISSFFAGEEDRPVVQLCLQALGGSESGVHALSAALYNGDGNILLSDDLPNAFNDRNRAKILAMLADHPQFKKLFKFVWFAYGSSSSLLFKHQGKIMETLLSENGVRQGCPIALFLFCLSVHPAFKLANSVPGVTAVAIADDLEFVGKPDSVFAAYDKVVAKQEELGINRVSDKRYVLWPHNEMPPESLRKQCRDRGIRLSAGGWDPKSSPGPSRRWVGGFEVALGIPFSRNEEAVREWLLEKVNGHSTYFDFLSKAQIPSQYAFMMLKSSGQNLMNYYIRCIHPSVWGNVDKVYDEMCLATVSSIIKQPIPLTPNGDVDLEAPLVKNLSRPTRLGGTGNRLISSVNQLAFVAAAAQALHVTRPSIYKKVHSNIMTDEEREAEAVPPAHLDLLEEHESFVLLSKNPYVKMLRDNTEDIIFRLGKGLTSLKMDGPINTSSYWKGKDCRLFQELVKQVVPTDFTSFLFHFDNEQKQDEDPPLIPSKGLQKAWTSLMENFQHEADWKTAPNPVRARWHSSSGKGATGWLNKLPGAGHGTLSHDQFTRCLRYRLGLPQRDAMEGACPMCHKDSSAHNHATVCTSAKKFVRGAVHDAIVQELHSFCVSETSSIVSREPEPNAQFSNRRTDLKIIDLEERLEVDVVTSDPVAISYVDKAAKIPGITAHERAKHKVAKHAKDVNDAGADFIPVSIELYGRQDKQVKELLAPMLGGFMNRQEMDGVHMPQRVEYILNRLSMATQRGLARSLRRFARLCRNATPSGVLLSRANANGYPPVPQRLRRIMTEAAKTDGWMSFYKKAKLQAAQAARDFLPDSQDEDRPSDDEESQDEESQDCDGYCFDDCDRCDRRYYGL